MCSAKASSWGAISDSLFSFVAAIVLVQSKLRPGRRQAQQLARVDNEPLLFNVNDERTVARLLRLQDLTRVVAEYHRLTDVPKVQLVRIACRITVRFRDFWLPFSHIERV